MKQIIPVIMVFAALNISIYISGLARLQSKVGLALFSGYHAHFLAFFALTFVLSLILVHKSINVADPFMISFIYAVFTAVLLEVLQLLVGYRDFSLLDMIAGGIGASCSWLLCFILQEKKLLRHWANI